MVKIKKQIKLEIKQLPFTLGKLTGGLMAVIGFPGMIIVADRKPNVSFPDLFPYLVLGISGVLIFLMSSILFNKRMNENDESVPTSKEKKLTSIISWMIFLIFITIFILVTYIINL